MNMFKINLNILRQAKWDKYIKRLRDDKNKIKVTTFKRDIKISQNQD